MSRGEQYFWFESVLIELALISQVLSMDQSYKVIFELLIKSAHSCSPYTIYGMIIF